MMQLLEHTQKIRAYCDYLDTHVRNVRRAWDGLQGPCKGLRFIYDDWVHACIESMVEDHDLSKVSAAEFIAYQRRFFPVGDADKEGFADAWEHHKMNNPHHWEHWTQETYSNPYAAEMHCVCMVVDWTAMAYEFGGSAEAYYLDNAEKIKLPAWAVTFIGEIFDATRRADVPCGSAEAAQ